jgi:hypothetical protein
MRYWRTSGIHSVAAVSNSFWEAQTDEQPTWADGTRKTTVAMPDIATFEGAGWNIVGVVNLGRHSPSYGMSLAA